MVARSAEVRQGGITWVAGLQESPGNRFEATGFKMFLEGITLPFSVGLKVSFCCTRCFERRLNSRTFFQSLIFVRSGDAVRGAAARATELVVQYGWGSQMDPAGHSF